MKQQPRPTIDIDTFRAWRDANPQPTPDLPMLRKTLAAIDADPAQWDQGSWGYFDQDQASGEWTCGTARCVAGWAATFAPTLVVDQKTWDGAWISVSDTGAYALGLTSLEAWDLFEGTLTLDLEQGGPPVNRDGQRRNIQIVAERIAARAGETL